MQVYYLVYKLTNMVNGKIYIGCHMTRDVNDGYMGSGKRLGYAKKKYGVENFKKEILSIHETSEEMLAEEAYLVNEEFLGREDVYNLTCGGRGSWFYVNFVDGWKGKSNFAQTNANNSKKFHEKLKSDPSFKKSWKTKVSIALKGRKVSSGTTGMKFKKTQGSAVGERNSQFGSCWVTDGVKPVKISQELLNEYLSRGYSRGRKTGSLAQR